MRCLACNKMLSDRAATRKYVSTGEFVDLCDRCLTDLPIVYVENPATSDLEFNDLEEEPVNESSGTLDDDH